MNLLNRSGPVNNVGDIEGKHRSEGADPGNRRYTSQVHSQTHVCVCSHLTSRVHLQQKNPANAPHVNVISSSAGMHMRPDRIICFT